MKEFKKIASNVSYELVKDDVIVAGSYTTDADGVVVGITGYCYRNVDGVKGHQFGDFAGVRQVDGEIACKLSAMVKADDLIVLEAIDNIKSEICAATEQPEDGAGDGETTEKPADDEPKDEEE